MASHHQYSAQYAPYTTPYLWGNAHQPPGASPPIQHPSISSHQHPNHSHVPSAQSAPQFTGSYIQSPSHYGTYPVSGYFPPSTQQMPPPHMMSQPMYTTDPRSMHGIAGGIGRNGPDGAPAPQHGRVSSRNSGGHNTMNGGGKRGGPPARAAWSYGPGIGMGGFGYGNPSGMAVGEVIGPRLNSVRRMSQTSSVGSGSTGNRTPAGDEASSTAVSRSPPLPLHRVIIDPPCVTTSHHQRHRRHHVGHIHRQHHHNIHYHRAQTGQSD